MVIATIITTSITAGLLILGAVQLILNSIIKTTKKAKTKKRCEAILGEINKIELDIKDLQDNIEDAKSKGLDVSALKTILDRKNQDIRIKKQEIGELKNGNK